MRVFAGLPLPEETKQNVTNIIEDFKQKNSDLNYVKPQGMHITLHFFGDLTEAQTEELLAAMESPELKVPQIHLSLGHLDQFPPRGNPRIIFQEIEEGEQDLHDIYLRYQRIIKPLDFVTIEARPFKAHITLARNKRSRMDPKIIKKYKPKIHHFTMDRLVLYKSDLKPTGPEYTALKTILFK